MGMMKYGDIEIAKYEIWKYGNVEILKYGNDEI